LACLSGVLEKRIDLGKGEVWALGAALGYALYQVFLRVALRGEGLNTMVGATVQAIPVLLFATAMGWFINRKGKETTSPFSDWRLIGALVVNGLLLTVKTAKVIAQMMKFANLLSLNSYVLVLAKRVVLNSHLKNNGL